VLSEYSHAAWLAERPPLVQAFVRTFFRARREGQNDVKSAQCGVAAVGALYRNASAKPYITPHGAIVALALNSLSGVGDLVVDMVSHLGIGVPSSSWVDKTMDTWSKLASADEKDDERVHYRVLLFDNIQQGKQHTARSRLNMSSLAPTACAGVAEDHLRLAAHAWRRVFPEAADPRQDCVEVKGRPARRVAV
jgi:hypothetical protein